MPKKMATRNSMFPGPASGDWEGASAWAKSSESTADSFAKAGRSNRGGRLLQPARRPASSSFRNESSTTSCVFSAGKARGTIAAGPRRKVKVPPVCWPSSPSTAARASSPSALAVEIARTSSPWTNPNSRSTPSRSMNRSPVLRPWDIIPRSSVGWTARSSPQRTATSSGARKSRTRWCCGLFGWLTARRPRQELWPRGRPRATSIRALLERFEQLFRVVACPTRLDGRAHPGHEVDVEGEVVQAVQPEREQLLRGEEMAQVGAGERPAGVAAAPGVGGARVPRVTRRLDLQPPPAGEEQAVARDAGGQHAVEQVDACDPAQEEVVGRADANTVARLVRRQERRGVRDAFPHLRRVLADREAAQRVAGQVERGDLGGVPLAQLAVEPSLDDPEQVAARVLQPLLLAAHRPARGPGDGLLVLLPRGARRRALVEAHQHVRAELTLHLHRALRGEQVLAPVEVAAEEGSLVRDLALLGQRVDLETARVGEDRSGPAHEAVEPAHLRDHLRPRAQKQVIGIAEDDLRADARQVVGSDRLHRARRPHGHELRRVDAAVRQLEHAAAGGAVLVADREREHPGGSYTISMASPYEKKRYRRATASRYAAWMRGSPAKAETSINSVLRGRWKFVSRPCTARKR